MSRGPLPVAEHLAVDGGMDVGRTACTFEHVRTVRVVDEDLGATGREGRIAAVASPDFRDEVSVLVVCFDCGTRTSGYGYDTSGTLHCSSFRLWLCYHLSE